MAVRLDYAVIRALLVARAGTATLGTGGVVRHQGEDGDEGNDLRVQHVSTTYTGQPRVHTDDSHAISGEAVFAVSVRESEETANVDAIDRACAAVMEVFDEYGVISGDHILNVQAVTSTITAPEQSPGSPTGTVTVSFQAQRDANATITDPAD